MTAPCCFCSIFVAVNRIWTRLDNFQIYLFKNFRRQARQFIDTFTARMDRFWWVGFRLKD